MRTVQKSKFPDISQGPVLQLNLSKDSNLRPAVLLYFCTNGIHFKLICAFIFRVNLSNRPIIGTCFYITCESCFFYCIVSPCTSIMDRFESTLCYFFSFLKSLCSCVFLWVSQKSLSFSFPPSPSHIPFYFLC